MATKKTAKKSANKKPVKKVAQTKQVTPIDNTSKKNKIIAIIIAIIIIVALLLCLTCCNKDNDKSPKNNKKKVVEEKEQKEEEKNVVPNYENVSNSVLPTKMMYEQKSVTYSDSIKELKDTKEPVVILNGDNNIIIECMYEEYEEKGAKYTDDFDGEGEINDPIRVTRNGEKVKSVDKNVPGIYVLTYLYTDNAGNNGIATRTVVVKDTRGPKTNISVAINRVGNTNSHNRIYTFNSSDPSDVKTVKLLYSTSVPNKEDFDNASILNSNAVTTQDGINIYSYGYELTVDNLNYSDTIPGNYYIYSEDKLGNYNIRKIVTVSVDNRKTENGITTVDVELESIEGYELTNVVTINGQSRIKATSEVNSDSFNNVPQDPYHYENTPTTRNYNKKDDYEVDPESESGNTIQLSTETNQGNHWYYIYCNYQNTEDESTQEFISNPISPVGY